MLKCNPLKRALTFGLFLLFILILSGCKDDSNPAETSQAPSITSISPTSGPPGSAVTINGSGFGSTAPANKVTFNGVLASVTSASSSSIEATVPGDATTGAVAVVVDGQTAVGPNFTVEEQLPGITAVEPDSGAAGTPVTIRGMNFDPNPAGNIVTFNGGVISTVDQASDTTLTTTVPVGAETGPIQVEVDGEKTLSPSFEVLKNGILEITTNTAGIDLDPDGYLITIDTGEQRVMDSNDVVTFSDLPAGNYDIELSGVSVNCRRGVVYTRNVNVTDGQTTAETFNLNCVEVGRLAYTRQQSGDADIWTMDGNGGEPINLTDSPDDDLLPRWSPDGTRIAFNRELSAVHDIYTMSEFGQNTINVVSDPADDVGTVWSSDGNTIIFVSDRSGDYDIWFSNASGTIQSNATTDPARDTNPSISPNDSLVTFISDRSGDDDIWSMKTSDVFDLTNLTDTPGDDGFHRWSPSGSSIVFLSRRTGNWDLWTMNPDGSNQINLTNNSVDDLEPTWSPDGSQIAYVSGSSGEADIWVINADGTNAVNLTNDSDDNRSPNWSPDGSRIVYTSDRSSVTGNSDIWFIWADGSGSIRLTETPAADEFNPRWKPQ